MCLNKLLKECAIKILSTANSMHDAMMYDSCNESSLFDLSMKIADCWRTDFRVQGLARMQVDGLFVRVVDVVECRFTFVVALAALRLRV